MGPHVSLGVVFGRLRNPLERSDLGQNLLEQTALAEQFEAAARCAFSEEFRKLLANPFRGNRVDLSSEPPNGRESSGFDLISESRRETYGAKHAEFILEEATSGITNGPHNVRAQILLTANVIEHFPGVVAHQQPVDGEVPPRNILLCGGRENDFIRVPAVGITNVPPKRGHFHLVASARYQNNSELRAYAYALWKQLQHRCRLCIGCDVVVRGLASEQQIAHATADEKCLVTLAYERIADRIG